MTGRGRRRRAGSRHPGPSRVRRLGVARAVPEEKLPTRIASRGETAVGLVRRAAGSGLGSVGPTRQSGDLGRCRPIYDSRTPSATDGGGRSRLLTRHLTRQPSAGQSGGRRPSRSPTAVPRGGDAEADQQHSQEDPLRGRTTRVRQGAEDVRGPVAARRATRARLGSRSRRGGRSRRGRFDAGVVVDDRADHVVSVDERQARAVESAPGAVPVAGLVAVRTVALGQRVGTRGHVGVGDHPVAGAAADVRGPGGREGPVGRGSGSAVVVDHLLDQGQLGGVGRKDGDVVVGDAADGIVTVGKREAGSGERASRALPVARVVTSGSASRPGRRSPAPRWRW